MIAASEPQEFVPFGRQKIKNHPGTILPPATQALSENSLVERLSEVNIDHHTDNEWWTLRELVVGEGKGQISAEEELYIKDKTAVWSRGMVGPSVASSVAGRSLVCSYTVETAITHALYVNFIKPVPNSCEVAMPSICLLDEKKVNVFTVDGEDFLSALQFKVRSAWSTQFGLLLERYSAPQTGPSDHNLATLFSLLHPLDEMAPLLIMKSGGSLQYMNDSNMKVVFTSEKPSLVVLFDLKTGLHSVWKLRKATPQESQVFCGGEYSTYTNLGQSSLHMSGFSQISNNSHRNSLPNRSPFTPAPAATSDDNSIFNFSPLDSLVRLQSPLDRFKLSTSNKKPGTPASATSGVSTPSALDARLGSSQMVYDGLWEPRPIEPQLTLEYIWTENLGVPMTNKGIEVQPALRVFLSTDVLGQSYLCYLVKARGRLLVARLSNTNTPDPDTLVGPATAIPAVDAASLPNLQMYAVLEQGGGVTLYTGTTRVGKVHVAGIHTALASSSYLTCATTGFLHLSPYPKRSSLLPSAQTDAMFDERVHLLSPVGLPSSTPTPVPPSTPTVAGAHDSHVHALRDSVHNRLTLEFLNGSMFRISLPEVSSSPLVTKCLTTLKAVLPREDAVQLVVQWYTARNAPGTQDISPQLEWQLFSKVLMGCLGYELSKLSKNTGLGESPDTPIKVKKKRSSDLGSQEDWTYLMSSEHYKTGGQRLAGLLGLQKLDAVHSLPFVEEGILNTSAPLFNHFYHILLALHLLYEELKLNLLMSDSLLMLAPLLQQLARDLRMVPYFLSYWKDFPSVCPIDNTYTQLPVSEVPRPPEIMPLSPPSIFQYLYDLLRRLPIASPYPCLHPVNTKSAEMIEMIGMLCSGHEDVSELLSPLSFACSGQRCDSDRTPLSARRRGNLSVTEHCVYLLSCLGYIRRDLTTLPAGISLVLIDAVNRVRENPPPDWPEAAYRLIGRQDLAATPPPPAVSERGSATPPPPAAVRAQDTDDGMDTIDREILKLRFNKDQRVAEVRRLLQSSQPVTIAITQRPDVSDHEFIEEQEKHLYTICTRTMALPIGRGMLTLHTACPVPSEPLAIPRLCLSGRAPPRGTTVDLTHIDVVPHMNLWPLFHNGVAAGLRIAPSAANIDTAWITYNKPKGTEALPEHAGFLMALGLNGHLNNLAQFNTCDYLSRCHEMTSIGILLGIAATKRGTMDLNTTKMLSLHIECLLPPTSVELDIAQNVQVAALLSIGLVYQGTAHRHITEILLSEMGRPPGPEMENSVDRESYALAAGLGLGMVVLGKGSDLSGLSDIGIADTLHYYMVGGHKRPLTGSQKEKYKSPSYQIREGDCVNIAVTSPGATLALGMMYFKTGNRAVANWMNAPDTQYLLDFVCPDALLLRMVARGLILWDDIEPSIAWVEGHVPTAIQPYCLVKPHPGTVPENVDLETMNQAYCNILAGACMAMGLRFAGSCNEEAFSTLLHYTNLITSLSNKSIAELAGKSTIEACLNVIVCSLAMVMAGSGDLDVLRVCRFLHSRVGQPTVTYGSHLASHMALGLLFLGGGRYTLSTSPPAIAALLCAFFPKYPTHSNDNRYHLQALRHLYVLAAESRLLLPRDIDTGSLCYAHITVLYLDTPHYKDQSFTMKAPCILPELKYLKEVRVEDDRYWRVTFTREKNWSQLQSMLAGCVGVKQRAGCLSYMEDPHGFRSLLAQTLTTDKAVAWTVPADSIFSFSSDPSTVNFAHYFLEQAEGSVAGAGELRVMHFLTKIVYECVTHDKLPIIPIWITIIKAIQSLYNAPCGILVWQLKLMIAHGSSPCDDGLMPSIAADMALSMKEQVFTILESWEPELMKPLWHYIHGDSTDFSNASLMQRFATYLTFHDFASPKELSEAISDRPLNPLRLQLKIGHSMSVSILRKICNLIASEEHSTP
ncbi:anaphase-promoting complex subunit 1 [Macrosteles quadrilineatus]|uniref:anaphase-promoting complex subunit 1 n=1 Tax=Macrosteles quadrilineatus TaxID=74068 RepID=UPI0023E28A84|nr:anaphase-promoting complex subunit 1 [Macrosteles quadrilineatus]